MKPSTDIMELDQLAKDLSGPDKDQRISALNSLGQDSDIDPDVVKAALDIESVPLTIFKDRERGLHLDRILRALQKDGTRSDRRTQLIALHHLLGSLYVNFEKFWDPQLRTVTDLIRGNQFQSTLIDALFSHLKLTNDAIYSSEGPRKFVAPDKRIDHNLHRNFILQIMSRFPSQIESRNRLFVEEFFRFVNNEMLCSPFIERYDRESLLKKLPKGDNEQTDDNNCNGSATEDKKSHRSEKDKLVSGKRNARQTFIHSADIFSSFTNIQKLYREAEFRNLMMDLLCCRDLEVQKKAFNCLLAYNSPHLNPYAIKLKKLLDTKKDRTELSMFSVDRESGQILPADRDYLMPIVLRIVFGKMLGAIGSKTSGRDKADARKTLVMRFMSGCDDEEILVFFRLVFEPIFQLIDVPYNRFHCDLNEAMGLENYVPLNKLQAILNTVAAYNHNVGHLKPETLKYIMKVMNIITYYVTKPLESQETLSKLGNKTIESLKTLRRSCATTLCQFFESFSYYNYAPDELNFIFERIVWPSTKGFIDKNYAHPTPTLKLISLFAHNKVYHKLLVKRNKDDREEYLLRHLIELYSSDKTQSSVLKMIATTISDIIDSDRDLHELGIDSEAKVVDDSQVEQAESKEYIINDADAVKPNYDTSLYKIEHELSFSEEILIPFIPSIFERLKKICSEFIEKKNPDNKIEKDELFMLSSLSKYLKDPEQSLLAVELLLNSLSYQKNGELINNTIRTTQTLILQTKGLTDNVIIDLIADILSFQRNSEQRLLLCGLLEFVGKVTPSLLPVSKTISLMNSIRPEHDDSPDLDRIIDGFKSAFDFLETIKSLDGFSLRNSIVLLIQQVGFMINNMDRYEFSTRENCISFIDQLTSNIDVVAKNVDDKFVDFLLTNLIMEKFVKKGLRDTNDSIRHTYVTILRSLAVNCNHKTKLLSELYQFCDDNQDLDFWLGIKHIQLFNRSKALARLINSDKLESVTPKTLSSYIMPLASSFLYNKTYKSLASLSENSIKLIGKICRRLNWITYESTLQYYLAMLTKANATYQRTTIKLITEILRNFNYDLTSCPEAMKFKDEDAKLAKRMRKRRGRVGENDEEDTKIIETDAPLGQRLNPSTARMIYMSVTTKLIPRLNSCLHDVTRVEFENDKNMADYMPEKDEIKRIPMAYAVVQLLNLLPCRYILFRDHLPTLFLKLTSFLKSKNEQVRRASRMTLIKIMTFVGPAYVPDLLRILKQNLDKGFLIHVLNYTIHSVLVKIPLSYGDLDLSVDELIDSCYQEIFGKHAEDKEVAQILAKTFEAKKTKSYDTFMILATNISAEKLNKLMSSIEDLLRTSSEAKKVNKLAVCIQKVFSGLAKNESFPLDQMLNFILVTITKAIPSLKVRQKVESAEKQEHNRLLREDRYLINKDPGRDRLKSRINERGNLHMVIENCLRLLLNIFEQNREKITEDDSIQKQIDGFIKILSTCLKSSSPKCIMRSLKCTHFIAQVKIDLPSFREKSESLVKKIFVLLSLYNGVGMVQGENLEMISMCFKTLTLLLLKCDHVKLNETQVHALLSYIEQDLNDTSRQATAFGTLNSILSRKLMGPNLADIMDKVADLLVVSEDDSVRSTSTKLWSIYLLEYGHESNKLQIYLTRFMRQLDYEHITGRRSVLSILSVVVDRFPESILKNYYELMFHLLAQRLVNEEDKDTRGSVGRLIGLIAQRMPSAQSHLLNKFVFTWASSDSVELKLLGVKLITVFVESCKSMFVKFRDRIKRILTVINGALNVAAESSGDSKDTDENQTNDVDGCDKPKESIRLINNVDKLSYHTLRLFKRLIDKGLIELLDERYISSLKSIWQNIGSSQITYWHLPVVLTSCELYLTLIKGVDLVEALNVDQPRTDKYLEWNAKRIIRNLCDKFFNLMSRVEESRKLMSYITDGLIHLGQVVAQSKATLEFERLYLESFEPKNIYHHLLELEEIPSDGFIKSHLPYDLKDAKKNLDLMWLSVKVVMQAKREAAIFRLTKNHRRDFVLRWIASISQELSSKRIAPYLALFLMTPVRELTDKTRSKASKRAGDSSQSIVMLSNDLLKFLKGLVGPENFNKIYSRMQLHYTKKRIERKQKIAIGKVKDQTKGTKRKLSKNKARDNAARKKMRSYKEARKSENGSVSRSKRSRTG